MVKMVCSISNVILLLLWIPVSSTYGQSCPSNKYGFAQCQYDCHCASNVDCHPRTGCSNVGPPQQKCALGWDGDTCQRQNVALGRPAQQSSTLYLEGKGYSADNAVDGKTGHNVVATPCTHTQDGMGNAWNVTLAKIYGIYRFTIYNRHSECCAKRLNGFQLSVGRTSDSESNYRLCYRDNTTSDSGPGDVITRTCNSPIDGELVQIKLQATTLVLCEVLIYVCSPGWYGEMCNNECVSDDNCSGCTASQQECAECNDGKWGADCNRACGRCWNSKQCDKKDGVCPKTASDKYRCSAGFRGDRCIQDCTAGSYGPDCLEPCGFCKAVSPACAKDTGVCAMTIGLTHRCLDGYRGDLCKEKCLPGTFGRNCSDQCGHCAGGQDKCSNINGRCSNTSNPRCAAGYTGDICKIVCSPGQYGGDCSETCGHCAAVNQSCAKDSGVCPQNSGSPRCSPEYKGDQCKDGCDAGEYGLDCSSECGMCSGGPEECDKRNGICLGGCADGFTGYNCQEETGDKDTGTALIGGIVGAVIGVTVTIAVGTIWKLRNKLSHKKKTVAQQNTRGHDPQQGSVSSDNIVTYENNTEFPDIATYENERTVPGSESSDMAAMTGDSEYETYGDDNYARLDMSNEESHNNDYAHLA